MSLDRTVYLLGALSALAIAASMALMFWLMP